MKSKTVQAKCDICEDTGYIHMDERDESGNWMSGVWVVRCSCGQNYNKKTNTNGRNKRIDSCEDASN